MYNVYIISSEINSKKLYKIGYTRKLVSERIKQFKTGNASEFEIVDTFKSKWGTKIEKSLHKHFRFNKIKGEWFELDMDQVMDFKVICEKYHNNFELLDKYNTYVIDRGGLSKIK